MRRYRALMLAALLVFGCLTWLLADTPAAAADRDCADFPSQAAAQSYFDARGGSATNNVDRLDGSDEDGRVCESLPCPCDRANSGPDGGASIPAGSRLLARLKPA